MVCSEEIRMCLGTFFLDLLWHQRLGEGLRMGRGCPDMGAIPALLYQDES